MRSGRAYRQKFLSTPSARRATFKLYGVAPVVFVFLSTPSARRATLIAVCNPPDTEISIHALREEGDVVQHSLCDNILISIHALREEGDLSVMFSTLS